MGGGQGPLLAVLDLADQNGEVLIYLCTAQAVTGP